MEKRNINCTLIFLVFKVSPNNPDEFNEVCYEVPGLSQNEIVINVIITIMGADIDCEIQVKDMHIIECVPGEWLNLIT